jgi:hypothetical protein
MQVQRRSILSVTNAGAAIRHGGGRTARDATSATAFGKSQPTWRKPFADHEAERRTKVQHTLGIRVLKPIEVKPSEERGSFISDSTIRFEMSIFGAIMNYAVKKALCSRKPAFRRAPEAQDDAA